ncbi:MAG: hypothetical protein AAB424_00675 [Patescibacteria group bacterium]
MNLEIFRSKCADVTVTDQHILAYIMDIKREGVQLTNAEKYEMCMILKIHRRADLAKKLYRNLDRHRK